MKKKNDPLEKNLPAPNIYYFDKCLQNSHHLKEMPHIV